MEIKLRSQNTSYYLIEVFTKAGYYLIEMFTKAGLTVYSPIPYHCVIVIFSSPGLTDHVFCLFYGV